MKARRLYRILQRHGWTLVRVRGSHHMFRHAKKTHTLVLGFLPPAEIHKNTVTKLLRDAEIDPKEIL